MMADPPGSGSAAGTRAGAEPRWWTVVVPCLLTLPASAWCLLLGVIAGISSTAGGPGPGPMPAIGVAEFIVGVGTIGTLIAGLAWRAGRSHAAVGPVDRLPAGLHWPGRDVRLGRSTSVNHGKARRA